MRDFDEGKLAILVIDWISINTYPLLEVSAYVYLYLVWAFLGFHGFLVNIKLGFRSAA